METKTFRLKDATIGKGEFTAVFATMNVIDSQNDMTLNGAFGDQRVIISGYGHASWNGGLDALPVGKGRIFERGDDAIVEGQFFLNTQAGQETFKTIQAVGDLQEFSYALPEIESEMKTIDGKTVRFLKKIRVGEVSPVLLGAGVRTRLLDIKADDSEGKSIQLLDHLVLVAGDARAVIEKLKHATDLRTADGRGPGAERMKRAAELKQALDELARELAGLEVVGGDKPTEIDGAMLAEAIRFALTTTAFGR